MSGSRREIGMKDAKSIGVLEYRSVALGLKAADMILKAAEVEMIMMQTVCPGKYIMMFTGKLSSVKAALEQGSMTPFDEVLVDSYMLGNPDESLLAAIYGTTEKVALASVGILESYSVASMVGVADQLSKTSPIRLIEVRLARGMSGKAYAIFAGEISAVEAAMVKGEELLSQSGFYLHGAVISNPDPRLWEAL